MPEFEEHKQSKKDTQHYQPGASEGEKKETVKGGESSNMRSRWKRTPRGGVSQREKREESRPVEGKREEGSERAPREGERRERVSSSGRSREGQRREGSRREGERRGGPRREGTEGRRSYSSRDESRGRRGPVKAVKKKGGLSKLTGFVCGLLGIKPKKTEKRKYYSKPRVEGQRRPQGGSGRPRGGGRSPGGHPYKKRYSSSDRPRGERGSGGPRGQQERLPRGEREERE